MVSDANAENVWKGVATMTREEAKATLYEWQKSMVDHGVPLDTSKVQALRVAIEALKAEPIRCGECENYIDRRCIEANHHVAAHGNCMNVFGAKRREL